MFVSDNWICFHSKVFGKDTKVVAQEAPSNRKTLQLAAVCIRGSDALYLFIQISIPVVSVTFIKKTKTALLVPNALVIETKSYQVRTLLTHSSHPRVLSTSINRTIIYFKQSVFQARVRVLPLAKHHVQVSQVNLRSSRGKIKTSLSSLVFVCFMFVIPIKLISACNLKVHLMWNICSLLFRDRGGVN